VIAGDQNSAKASMWNWVTIYVSGAGIKAHESNQIEGR
jgi:hypothetical protein